jgi:hypothetical protein
VKGSAEIGAGRAPRDRGGWPLVGVSFLFALAASTFLLLAPVVTSVGATISSDGDIDAQRSASTLLEENGAGVLLVLAGPVAVAALALLAQRTGVARGVAALASALLVAFAVVAGASVGLLYWPAAAAMLLAAARRPA